ncbi:MAG: Ubiquinone biosynthesis O-methyltransferase [Nitrosomonadaceae bacterium]|nr:Ubiquinone biosynthesis O-methyltransferase [Nitrosomonadaceae bacterium]
MMGDHLSSCPVCLAGDLQKNYIISKAGFLSLPSHPHSLCRSCGSVLLDPRPSAEQLKAFYQSQTLEAEIERDVAQNSADRILDPVKYAYFMEHRIKPLSQFLDPDKPIFDVGCGVGAFVKAMKDLHYTIAGSDLSLVSLQVGKELFGLSSDELLLGDMCDIAGRESYGCITLWTVIEHLLNPAEYLQFVYGRLDTGGILLVEFPTVDSLMFEYCKDDFFWVMPPYHIYLYSVRGMKIMLERAGFELLLEHRMPRNWNFFEVLARKSGCPAALLQRLRIEAPDFGYSVDVLLDDIALSLGKSSSIQLIARKK